MDIETAEALDTLRSDIRRVEREVVRVETSLNSKIERVEASLSVKIEHVETSLTARMDAHKRHTDVRLESMHDDIRMLAEHVVTLSSKVDSLRR